MLEPVSLLPVPLKRVEEIFYNTVVVGTGWHYWRPVPDRHAGAPPDIRGELVVPYGQYGAGHRRGCLDHMGVFLERIVLPAHERRP